MLQVADNVYTPIAGRDKCRRHHGEGHLPHLKPSQAKDSLLFICVQGPQGRASKVFRAPSDTDALPIVHRKDPANESPRAFPRKLPAAIKPASPLHNPTDEAGRKRPYPPASQPSTNVGAPVAWEATNSVLLKDTWICSLARLLPLALLPPPCRDT